MILKLNAFRSEKKIMEIVGGSVPISKFSRKERGDKRERKGKEKKEEVWSQSRKRLNCLTTRIMQMGRRSAHASSNSFVPWNCNVQTAWCKNVGKSEKKTRFWKKFLRCKIKLQWILYRFINAIIASFNDGELKWRRWIFSLTGIILIDIYILRRIIFLSFHELLKIKEGKGKEKKCYFYALFALAFFLPPK